MRQLNGIKNILTTGEMVQAIVTAATTEDMLEFIAEGYADNVNFVNIVVPNRFNVVLDEWETDQMVADLTHLFYDFTKGA